MLIASPRSSPVSPITRAGEFRDPAAERSYLDGVQQDVWPAAYLVIILTAAVSLAFVPFDVMTLEGGPLRFFLIVRLIIGLISAVALAWVAQAPTSRQVLAATYLHQYAFFILNGLVFAHPLLERVGGLFFPLTAMALWISLPGSFRAVAALCAYAPMVSLLFWGVVPTPSQPLLDLAVIAMLTAGSYAVGAVARIRLNRARREEYLHIQRAHQTNLQLEEAKRQAEESARLRSEFLAVMSHEIRTPMNAVLGMVSLMGRDAPTAAQTRRLEIIEQAGRRLVQLCDEALDLSRLEAGAITLKPAPIELATLVNDVVELMRPTAQAKGLALALRCRDLAPGYSIDPLRLQQVLLNLLTNAIQYTDVGGIDMSVDAEPMAGGRHRLTVRVDDSGPGIPDHAKATIFEAFRQYERPGRHGGAGLGLSIVDHLARAMGGAISIADRPGGGARFTFTFCAETAAVEIPARPTPLPLVAPMDILVVEDAAENQMILREYLEPLGHRVVAVDDGALVCPALLRHAFDIVLMDIRLAAVDGVEATRRVRALPDPALATIPILAVTANVSADDERAYLDAGIDELLAKPIEPNRLFAALARHAPASRTCPSPREETRIRSSARKAMELFRAACREQGPALDAAELDGNHQRLAAIAHRMKGSAGSFGYPALGRAAAAVSVALSQGDEAPSDLGRAIADLRREMAVAAEAPVNPT